MQNVLVVESFLSERGFARHPRPDSSHGVKSVLYQRRLENVEPVSELDGQLFVNVTLHQYQRGDVDHASAEVELHGQQQDGDWVRILIGSVALASLPTKLAKMERKLIEAWKVACAVAAEPEEGANQVVGVA